MYKLVYVIRYTVQSKFVIFGRRDVVWRIDREDWLRNATCRRSEERKKKIKETKMWYFTYAPRPPRLSDDHQIWHMGWGRGRNQPCQVSCKSIHKFWLPEGSKFALFLYLVLWLIQQPPDHTSAGRLHLNPHLPASWPHVCYRQPVSPDKVVSSRQPSHFPCKCQLSPIYLSSLACYVAEAMT